MKLIEVYENRHSSKTLENNYCWNNLYFFISLISTNEFLQHFSDRALTDRISKHSYTIYNKSYKRKITIRYVVKVLQFIKVDSIFISLCSIKD